MTDEAPRTRGEAAWKENRDAIAKRNAQTRKDGQAERRSRDRAVEVRERALAARELQELDALNDEIDRRRETTG
jgi:hypothetical protein